MAEFFTGPNKREKQFMMILYWDFTAPEVILLDIDFNQARNILDSVHYCI